jgi:hypothetical protein
MKFETAVRTFRSTKGIKTGPRTDMYDFPLFDETSNKPSAYLRRKAKRLQSTRL